MGFEFTSKRKVVSFDYQTRHCNKSANYVHIDGVGQSAKKLHSAWCQIDHILGEATSI